jgi:fumarylacetoacetase
VGVPGARIRPDEFAQHVFGVVLVNDWSARDIQAWEYQPLGPFLAKSFATSISHWVTPLDELPRTTREPQDPPPLPYLAEAPWAFDLPLELELNGTTVARTNADQLYWSVAQQIAHLTVNGAALRAGDLLGSGTISGPEKHQRGCLLELSWNGEEPIALDDGSTRTFLEDGDVAVLRGAGLGEVRGRVSGR